MTKRSFSVLTSDRGFNMYRQVFGAGGGQKTGIVVIVLTLVLFASLFPAKAAEPPLPPPVLAIIDLQRAMVDSAAGSGVRKQREQYLSVYQTETSKEEKELRDAGQELSRQQTLLSADAFAEKQNAFRQRLSDFQHMVDVRRRNVDKVTSDAVEKIHKHIIEISAAVAKEKGVTMVLNSSSTFLFSGKYDITDAVMERLNKILPKVAVADPTKIPQSGPEATPQPNPEPEN
ncbi:MAG: OmpH family outer membrane protein [Alphaproteobacteria bacterium]|nr:OmpH family outer membrane protein [Alphaproteobacteria bacterium]